MKSPLAVCCFGWLCAVAVVGRVVTVQDSDGDKDEALHWLRSAGHLAALHGFPDCVPPTGGFSSEDYVRQAHEITCAARPKTRKDQITVSCLGDSITAGFGASGPNASYPALLQQFLGDGYVVSNFGASGATMQKEGNSPYWQRPQWTGALASRPNIVVLMLGTNDARTYASSGVLNWLMPGDVVQPEHAADRPKVGSCIKVRTWHSKPSDWAGQLGTVLADDGSRTPFKIRVSGHEGWFYASDVEPCEPALPKGWEAILSEKEAKKYYVNRKTNASQWERPASPEAFSDPGAARFKASYEEMIQQLQDLSPSPEIFLAIPPPLYFQAFGVNQTIVNDVLPPLVRRVVREAGLHFEPIDIFQTLGGQILSQPSFLRDGCHPNDEGYAAIAHHVARAVQEMGVGGTGHSTVHLRRARRSK